MALIYTYPPIGSIEDADLLLVSDVSLASNATRNMDLGTFASYIITSRNIITGTGTKDTIPVFITPTTIGDSVMTKVNGGLRIAGGLTITDFLIADGGVRLLGPTPFSANILNVNGTTNLNGTLAVAGESSFNGDATFEETANFQSAVLDQSSNPGTAGQVLSSTGNGVQWVSDGGGNVIGLGTTGIIPVWTDGPNSALGDGWLQQSTITTGGPSDIYQIKTDPKVAQFIIDHPDDEYGSNPAYIIRNQGNINRVELGYDIGNPNDPNFPAYAYLTSANDFRLIVSNLAINGVSTFNANALFEAKAEFQGTVADSQGNVGTAGQVLSSTAGGVQWVTDEGGNVTGTGDNLTAAMWLGATPFNVSSIAASPLSFAAVGTDPSNIYSLQFGTNSVASGDFNSVVLGYGNLSSNKSTLATGFGTTASGLHAASFNFETIASGQKSAAFGSESVASGTASFVVGLRNTAATSNAFAGGLDSTANPSLNGTSAFAFGNALNVTGQDAASFGKGNSVTGAYSFSAGFGNTLSNANSFALGRLNSVQAEQSSAIGTYNAVSGYQSHAIGVSNAVGAQNSIAVGYNLVTGNLNQVVVGKYNSSNASAVFVVGNGASGSEGNAIEVYYNNIKIPDYGSGVRTGNAAYNLQVDATGTIIETQAAGDYKELVALINQVGTQAPITLNTLSNTLGVAAPLAWTYVSPGVYNLNAPGKFKTLKTVVFANNGNQTVLTDPITWVVVDTDNIKIRTGNTNGQLIKAAIEIRTYI